MSTLLKSFRRFIGPAKPIPSGSYHYQAPPDDPRNYRLHLRIEADGSGVLIINASTILHLNQSAAEYAYFLVKNMTPEQAADEMTARYDVSKDQASHDYQDLIDRIQILINTPDLDPITFLDFERQIPFSGHITAPYRLDCALTYQLAAGADSDAALGSVSIANYLPVNGKLSWIKPQKPASPILFSQAVNRLCGRTYLN